MWSSSSRWNKAALAAALLALVVAAPAEQAVPKLLLWERGSIEKLISSAPEPWNRDAKFGAILRAMAEGYPKEFAGVEFPPGKPVRILIGKDTTLVYDDGRAKTFEQKLDEPDLEDTFSQLYPLSNPTDK